MLKANYKPMPHKSRKADVLIVGAGPVGLTAAIELKRRGFHPRIIDANTGPNPNSRALAVNPRTLDLLAPCGATEALVAEGIAARKLVIRRNIEVLARIDLSTIPHKYNFLLIISQHKTEQILERCLLSQGVKVERNMALVSTVGVDAPLVTLSNGEKMTPQFVIGADGAHSVVRKSLSIGFDGESDKEQFGLADVTVQDWPFDFETVVLTILDNHLAPFLPLGENFGRFITTKPDCLAHLPSDAKIKDVAWSTDFTISYRQAATYQSGGVFIVGDAAHIHSPVGGRGMNLGIEDACWLAWLISQGRQNEYTDLRHPVGAKVLKFTHRFTAFAKARGPFQDLVIKLALPIFSRSPFLQRRLFHNLTALNTPPAPWLSSAGL